MINKDYCMSSYLAFRFIEDENMNFFEGLKHENYKTDPNKEVCPCKTALDMDAVMKKVIKDFYIPGKTAIFLSGGMDSAIVASYLPEKTKAYTFKCVAEGALDETEQAKKYCDAYGLDQEVIEMHWSDFEALTPEIIKADGVPFHSIEVQLLKACKIAKEAGYERILTGGGDVTFGGLSKLLSKDWEFDEFVNKYMFCDPKKVLKNPVSVIDTFERYRLPNNKIDYQRFISEVFATEADTSYMHIWKHAGVESLDPYSHMFLAEPLDLERIRSGDSKYLTRELFRMRYPNIPVPEKTPMPRAVNQWLKDYQTTRDEFIPNCADNLTGDQKWLCWCLEQFLNMHDRGEL